MTKGTLLDPELVNDIDDINDVKFKFLNWNTIKDDIDDVNVLDPDLVNDIDAKLGYLQPFIEYLRPSFAIFTFSRTIPSKRPISSE